MQRKQKSKDFRTYIHKLCAYFIDAVRADEYEVDIAWREKETQTVGDRERTASMWVDPVYLNAELTIWKPSHALWKDKKYRALANVICHEFCHLLTEPLYMFAIEAQTDQTNKFLLEVRERQTERIANSIMRLVPESAYLPLVKRKK